MSKGKTNSKTFFKLHLPILLIILSAISSLVFFITMEPLYITGNIPYLMYLVYFTFVGVER